MKHNKKGLAGRNERIKILGDYLPRIVNHLASRRAGGGIDDLLDAAVAALGYANYNTIAEDYGPRSCISPSVQHLRFSPSSHASRFGGP